VGEVRIESMLRELAPQVLALLVRRHGQFDACEDAVQEALLAATVQWPGDGVPDNPRAWLLTVASRRLIDEWRSESARQRRELVAATTEPADPAAPGDVDDTLRLLFLCCHPSLSQPSQLALTLRAVGGLNTAQIAAAYLVPESTMAQRISRAKERIRSTGLTFDLPPEPERAQRLNVVLQVLYLIFNEGYTASSGSDLQRRELTGEAIRLTRMLRQSLIDGADEADEAEVAGLLALMLLTDARRTARTAADGSLVLLSEQDRSLWNRVLIEEGVQLVTAALARGPLGSYQVQAAIAAVHVEAPNSQETDWPQVLALYQVLEQISPGPVVTLNRAVALAMVEGPAAGLALLDALAEDERMTRSHRLAAVRAHLLEQAGDDAAARESYLSAARMTASLPEQRYLRSQAGKLSPGQGGPTVDQ
jgi:RNA polymerase sigma factor (sigma-70 family)